MWIVCRGVRCKVSNASIILPHVTLHDVQETVMFLCYYALFTKLVSGDISFWFWSSVRVMPVMISDNKSLKTRDICLGQNIKPLAVCTRACLRAWAGVLGRIFRKRFKIEARFQRNTNKKWDMANRFIALPITSRDNERSMSCSREWRSQVFGGGGGGTLTYRRPFTSAVCTSLQIWTNYETHIFK